MGRNAGSRGMRGTGLELRGHGVRNWGSYKGVVSSSPLSLPRKYSTSDSTAIC